MWGSQMWVCFRITGNLLRYPQMSETADPVRCLLFFFFLRILLKHLFICLWLHWIFIAVHGLSLVVASRGYSLLSVCGLLTVLASCCRAQALKCGLSGCGALV